MENQGREIAPISLQLNFIIGGLGGAMGIHPGSPQGNLHQESRVKSEDLFGEMPIFGKMPIVLEKFRPFLCENLCTRAPTPAS